VPKGFKKDGSYAGVVFKKGENSSILTQFQKGFTPWNKGLLGWNKGFKHSKETKNKLRIMKIGIKFSKKHIENLRKSHLGYIPTLEHRRKVGIGNKGKYVSPETCKKISLANMGEKNHCWRGGVFLSYPYEFKSLRESIRQRDNYKCQVCGVPQLECSQELSVHHIDYNKNNLKTTNLISMCKSCHQKTNFKREYWIQYFKGGYKCETK